MNPWSLHKAYKNTRDAHKVGKVLGTLAAAKDEMERRGKPGSEEYYNRLSMCTSAQDGIYEYLATLFAGLAEENYNIFANSYNTLTSDQPIHEKLNSTRDIFNASVQNMENKFQGAIYGLTNPDEWCRTWLKDLDVKYNKW